MTTRNSSRTSKQSKPTKPQRPEGSPLFWHASQRWCKKIRGRHVYFGRGSHDDALAEYKRQKDELHAGRVVREEPEGLTVAKLCGKFLDAKKDKRDSGGLSPRTFMDYAATCKLIMKLFGKDRLVADLGEDDFAKARRTMSKSWGPVRLHSVIGRCLVVFNYAYNKKRQLIPRPILRGEGFDKPDKKALREHRQSQGPRMYEAAELRRMLDRAEQPLRSMLLLGVNCGFGNADVGKLPLSALDLGNGWVDFPRPKTSIARRIPLWPETVQALRDWLTIRPKPMKQQHVGLVFLTAKGDSFAKEVSDNPVSKLTAKLLKTCGIDGHRNFYCLRHTFQTIGDESGDFVCVKTIMGHSFSGDISAVYRERISDERLRRVVEHVRGWLFAPPEESDGKADVLRFKKAE